MSVVIRLKVPIEMHYTVIPMGTSKVNSSRGNLNEAFSKAINAYADSLNQINIPKLVQTVMKTIKLNNTNNLNNFISRLLKHYATSPATPTLC